MVRKSTKKTSSSTKSRDFRQEAGRPSLKKVQHLSSSESSTGSSDSDVESALDIPVKDDSRRSKSSKGKQRSVNSRLKHQLQKIAVSTADDDTDDEVNNMLAKQADSKIAPHMVLISGSTYHIEFSPITHPAVSYFVPWSGNFFAVLFNMAEVLWSSTLVQETIPDYFSPALYWYGSMVFILQILRAKDAAGVLTRDERQVLQTIIRTYPLEQWTILSPMIGFLQSLGSVKPADPMYSWISPNFPPFNGFTTAHCYRGISKVPGIQRFPPILAYQKFIFNFGAGLTHNHNAFVLPQANVTPQTQFVGLNNKAADDDDWQTFINSYGWQAPPETGSLVTTTDLGLKIRSIRRWSVPDVSNTLTVTNLKTFLGLSDDEPISWMSRILRMIKALENFFPASTNLANISPTTSLASIADVDVDKSPIRVSLDGWYYERSGISINVISPSGFDDSSQLRLSAATAFNASLSESVHAPLGQQSDSLRSGPFFENSDEEHDSVPLIQFESGARTDPVIRFSEIIESKLFNRNGGRN